MHISRFYPAGVGNNIENGPSSPAKNRNAHTTGREKKNPFVVLEMHLTVLGTATTNNKNRKKKKKNGKRFSLYWTIKSHWMKRGCRLLLLLVPLFLYLLLLFLFFYYIEVVVVVVASERTSFAKPAPVTSSRTEREHCRY